MTDEKIETINTGIKGLDNIIGGGFKQITTNLICGLPGTGKTILIHHLAFNIAKEDRKVLFVSTISEPSFKMIHFLRSFEFYEEDKVYSDIHYRDLSDVIRKGSYPDAIDQIIEYVEQIDPQIVVIDSFKSLEEIADSKKERHRFTFDLTIKLSAWSITSFFIGEYKKGDNSPIFAIADSIMFLLRKQSNFTYWRYLDVVKKRGSLINEGLHPFKISEQGIKLYPRLRVDTNSNINISPTDLIKTGIDNLDEMFGGGLIRNSTTMLVGSTGTGKTLMGLNFLIEGAKNDDKGLLYTFKETREQLISLTSSFGWNLEQFMKDDLIEIEYVPPVNIHSEIFANKMLDQIIDHGYKRVVIDSINDFELISTHQSKFRELISALTHNLKQNGVTTIVTNEISEIFGQFKLSNSGISFIADNVVLLRYLELLGEMGRSINLLKARGLNHDKSIKFFEINDDGLQIGEKIKAITGVLTGNPIIHDDYISEDE